MPCPLKRAGRVGEWKWEMGSGKLIVARDSAGVVCIMEDRKQCA